MFGPSVHATHATHVSCVLGGRGRTYVLTAVCLTATRRPVLSHRWTRVHNVGILRARGRGGKQGCGSGHVDGCWQPFCVCVSGEERVGGVAVGAQGTCVWERVFPGGSCLCREAGRLLGEPSVCVFVHVWKSCVFTERGFKKPQYKRERFGRCWETDSPGRRNVNRLTGPGTLEQLCLLSYQQVSSTARLPWPGSPGRGPCREWGWESGMERAR